DQLERRALELESALQCRAGFGIASHSMCVFTVHSLTVGASRSRRSGKAREMRNRRGRPAYEPQPRVSALAASVQTPSRVMLTALTDGRRGNHNIQRLISHVVHERL